ncbi:hypothetical protein [Desulfuromonas sp. TF]|uniref:hypothetical protein n=1 Tax=Desulfuromonas sp. TF TaxID=1232410 RepID=UPI000687522F|nr:hypothetical protein [Desulfuromonas sp. TF]
MKPAIFGGNTPPLSPGVSVRVYQAGTAVLATVYDFASGLAIDQAGLPLVADALGRFSFTADAGQMVDVKIGGEGTAADLAYNGGAARWFKNYPMVDPKSYTPDNVLGAVSQAGGVPTGAIIERGSNANGEYIKFADGTQICTKTGGAVQFVNSSNLNFPWTYPASFVSMPFVVGNIKDVVLAVAKDLHVNCYEANTTNAFVSVLSVAQFVLEDAVGSMDALAIGRWF